MVLIVVVPDSRIESKPSLSWFRSTITRVLMILLLFLSQCPETIGFLSPTLSLTKIGVNILPKSNQHQIQHHEQLRLLAKSSLVTSTTRKQTYLYSASYGRGAEIWPECNEDAVKLEDSFPDGQVPSSFFRIMEQKLDELRTIEEIDDEDNNEEVVVQKKDGDGRGKQEISTMSNSKKPRRSKRKMVSNTIQRILRQAAEKEELELEQQLQYLPNDPKTTPMDRTPSVIAIALLVRGLVRPFDVLVVTILTSYFVLLQKVAQSPRNTEKNNYDNNVPILPALPPQGHVPGMVLNPMGVSFTYSKSYDVWLKCGAITGLFGPLILLFRNLYKKDMITASLCARPVFLLCCQAISEAFSRRILAPLPIRILIPILYNTIRLGYLWQWGITSFTTSAGGGVWGMITRVLSIANLMYWVCNLFVFLIPVATLRYMRAHFFGVEAEEVTTRKGMEDSIGFIPH